MFLFLADFLDEWLGWTVAGLLPEVRGYFGFDYTRAGLVIGAHFLGGYIGSAVGGLLADSVGRRRLLVCGTLLYALGFVVAAEAPVLPVFLLGCFLVGLASGPVVNTAQLILTDRARHDHVRLERFLGRFNALGGVGDILGPIVLAFALGAGVGWRLLFGAAAVVIATYGLVVLLTSREQQDPAAVAARPLAWARLRATILDPRILRLALALALLDSLDEPFAGFVMVFLRDVAAVSAASANAIVTTLVGFSLLGFALVAHLTASRDRTMRGFLIILATAIPVFLLTPLLPLRVVCLGLIGFASAGFYTAALAEVLSLRPEASGTTMSVLSVVGALSLALPPLVGALCDAHGMARGMLVYAGLPPLMLLLVGRLGRSSPA